jgi:hypothetical protein
MLTLSAQPDPVEEWKKTLSPAELSIVHELEEKEEALRLFCQAVRLLDVCCRGCCCDRICDQSLLHE